MIARAQEWEIDLEHLGKRKTKTKQVTGVSGKKSKGSDTRSKGHMMALVEWDRRAARSAARRCTLASIVLPCPYCSDIRYDLLSLQSKGT